MATLSPKLNPPGMQRIGDRSNTAGDSRRRLTWSVSVVAPAVSEARRFPGCTGCRGRGG